MTAARSQSRSPLQSAYFAIVASSIQNLSATLPKPLSMGVPLDTDVTVNAIDGYGYPVTGALPEPISVTDSDTSGQTTLGAASITNANQPIPFKYNGVGGAFTLTASYGSVTGSNPFVATLPQEVPITGVPSEQAIQVQVVLQRIIPGPGGNFWSQYATSNTENGVAFATPAGALTVYSDPNSSHWADSDQIAEDGSGNVWIDYHDSGTEGLGFDKVSPSGQFTSYSLPSSGFRSADFVTGIVLGPDGAIWFSFSSADSGVSQAFGIGRIDAAGNATNVGPLTTTPTDLIVGPDNNFWFSNGAFVDRMTPTGTITSYSLTGANVDSQPLRFIVGPDGNFWAPYAYGTQTLLKFSTNGSVVSTTPLAYGPLWEPSYASNAIPVIDDIETDGKAVYVADVDAQGIIRIDGSGVPTEYPTYATLQNVVQSEPINLAFGANGSLYMASTAITNESMQSGYVGALTPIGQANW